MHWLPNSMSRDMPSGVTARHSRDIRCLHLPANQHKDLSRTAHYVRPAAACDSSLER